MDYYEEFRKIIETMKQISESLKTIAYVAEDCKSQFNLSHKIST